MAKAKDKKPRPDKYAQKVSITVGFDEVLQIFSDIAHGNIPEKIEEPEIEPSEEV
jgi:hypothetical protein